MLLAATWIRYPRWFWLLWVVATAVVVLLVTIAWIGVETLWPAHTDDFMAIYSDYRGSIWLQVLRVIAIWWLPVALAQRFVVRRYASNTGYWVLAVPLSYLLSWPLRVLMYAEERALYTAFGSGPMTFVVIETIAAFPHAALIAGLQWLALSRLIGSFWWWVLVNAGVWSLLTVPPATIQELEAGCRLLTPCVWHWYTLGLGGRMITAADVVVIALVQGYWLERRGRRWPERVKRGQ